eukprot:TRINITY_DN4955_c0_g1_i2.p1 TRINITY_DN4955_c0_g1~~TRINITY_DN4955_c0_g1_i2.p1  ORF type:complete len:2381 (+),score=448.46 TRINITY_DN4955_c0_g1_i2:166-7308(+)
MVSFESLVALALVGSLRCATGALPDFLPNTWRQLLPDPAGTAEQRRLIDHCSAGYNGKLYIFAGMSREREHNALYAFDLVGRRMREISSPAGAPWPDPRHKCRMAADPSSGALYLFGGVTRSPVAKEFTDFWAYDTYAQTWTELPSGGLEAPVASSMDGDMAVISGHVVIAGADDGAHEKTFRYSIARGMWLPPLESGFTALNKPTLVAVGQRGYLIGGYTASGEFPGTLLLLDLSAGAPSWQRVAQSGAVPKDDGMKGGALSDGSIVVMSTKGDVHRLNTRTGGWAVLQPACGAAEPRDDFTGAVVGDLLVVMGGTWGGRAYTGDVQAFSTVRRGDPLPCMSLSANRWQELIPNPASGAFRTIDQCSAVLGGVLYLLGGQSTLGKGVDSNLRLAHLRDRRYTVASPAPGAAWPRSRYKCKMAAHAESGVIYMFGGKVKTPESEELTDFWRYHAESKSWTELPHTTTNAPVAESMDGDMAIIGGQVVIAGADDGSHGKTFRYSIAQGRWLAVVEDAATALNKPTLVAVGMRGYLIGGYTASGEFPGSLLMLDLAGESVHWQQLGQSGAVPEDDGMKGGTLSDGSVVVMSTKGAVHRLDPGSGAWGILQPRCSTAEERDDFSGETVDDYLVIAAGTANGDEFRGDVRIFSPFDRGGSAAASDCVAWLSAPPGRWTQLLDGADTAVMDHCSASLGRRLYVFGGVSGSPSASDRRLRVYDLEQRSLSLLEPPTGAPWPTARYKCKMDADPAAGVLYMFGGKTKTPETAEFSDFWAYSTASSSWTELPSGSDSGPLAASMDGDLKVVGGTVLVTGADDGVYGRTFRYSITQQLWLPVIASPVTALNKPLLVAAGSRCFLIGGYDAAGTQNDKLYVIGLADAAPHWQQQSHSGAVPANHALKGGLLPGAGAIVVYSSTGVLHTLDLPTMVWTAQGSGCRWIPPRADYAGEVVDGVLAVVGGVSEEDGDNAGSFLGDLWVYVPGEDAADCPGGGGPGQGGGNGNAGSGEEGVPLGRPLRRLSLAEQGFRLSAADLFPSGICFSTRRFFVALTETSEALAVFPYSLQPHSGKFLADLNITQYSRHAGMTCDSVSGRIFLLHLTDGSGAERVSISEFRREGENLKLLETKPAQIPSACRVASKLCSWGLGSAHYHKDKAEAHGDDHSEHEPEHEDEHDAEDMLFVLEQGAPRDGGHNGTVWLVRSGPTEWEIVKRLVLPRAMADHSGIAVSHHLRLVLVTSLFDSRMLVTRLTEDQGFDASVAALFDFPRSSDGGIVHCNVAGVAWITDAAGYPARDADGGLLFATVSGNRAGSVQKPGCVAEEKSINVWRLPPNFLNATREEVLQQLSTTPAPTATAGTFSERMRDSPNPWVFLGAHPQLERQGHSAAVLNATMWVFGGLNANGEMSDELLWMRVEDFTWGSVDNTLGALWPPLRRGGVMVADEGRGQLHLLGGVTTDGLSRSFLHDFWAFDIASQTWEELRSFKNGERYAPGPPQGSHFAAAGTERYLVVIGSLEGSESTWMVYDKGTRRWLAPFAERHLAVGSPAIARAGPDLLIACGGIRGGSYLPRYTLMLRTTGNPDHWVWEMAERGSTAPPGNFYTMQPVGQGAVVVLGDPFGKGRLGDVGGAAVLPAANERWAEINRTADWAPARSGFSAVSVGERVIVFGGAVGSGGEAVSTGEIWGYDPRRCPFDCNGRGDCHFGNCLVCRGSHGVACEILDPEGTDLVPIIVGAAAGVLILFAALGIVLWRSTAETRKYRRLYDTARLAEDMARQIEAMDLDGLDYLRHIEHPTPTQKAFLSIVSTLQGHQAYIPQMIILEAQQQRDAVQPPTGEVAIMFSDIVQSTRLWESNAEVMTDVLEQHNGVLRQQIRAHCGYEVKTIGDAFMVSFGDAADAMQCALSVQSALLHTDWPDCEEFERCHELWSKRSDSRGNLIWGGIAVRIGVSYGDAQSDLKGIGSALCYLCSPPELAARFDRARTVHRTRASVGSQPRSVDFNPLLPSDRVETLELTPSNAAGSSNTSSGLKSATKRHSGTSEWSSPTLGLARGHSMAGQQMSAQGPMQREGSVAVVRQLDRGVSKLARESSARLTYDLGKGVAAVLACAARTQGQLAGLLGTQADVMWNMQMICAAHSMQSLLFVSLFSPPNQPAVVGISSGLLCRGSMGSSRHKYFPVYGFPVHCARSGGAEAMRLGLPCLAVYEDQPPGRLPCVMHPIALWGAKDVSGQDIGLSVELPLLDAVPQLAATEYDSPDEELGDSEGAFAERLRYCREVRTVYYKARRGEPGALQALVSAMRGAQVPREVADELEADTRNIAAHQGPRPKDAPFLGVGIARGVAIARSPCGPSAACPESPAPMCLVTEHEMPKDVLLTSQPDTTSMGSSADT